MASYLDNDTVSIWGKNVPRSQINTTNSTIERKFLTKQFASKDATGLAGTASAILNNNTSFRIRGLRVQLTLRKGQFRNGTNSIMIADLAMTANIEKCGAPDFGKANVTIYGLPMDVMEQLTTLSMMPQFYNKNYINIFAGDEIEGYSQVFAGTIQSASADFNSQPDIKMNIQARVGFEGSITAQGQNVVSGSQPVADFIAKQAKTANMTFENNGVSSSLKNAVFSGSPIEQAKQAAEQVGAELVIDDDKMTLIPQGGSVKGTVPKLSATAGLLGYPTMSQNGIDFKAIFNPEFKFAGLIELETLVPKCSGQWRIIKLSHKLSSNMPSDGSWESQITAFNPQMSGACGRFI